MNNWRTNLGGAIGTLGTTLVTLGAGNLAMQSTQPGELPSKINIYLIIAGGIISAVGKSVTALFAADAKEISKQLETINKKTDETTTYIKNQLNDNK